MRAGQRESASLVLDDDILPTTIYTFVTRATSLLFYSLVSISESMAQERTLAFYAANPLVVSGLTTELSAINYIAGDELSSVNVQIGGTISDRLCVGLRLRYAIGETENVLYCDAKPGLYNIPPCSRFTADLFAWRCGTVISAIQPVNVSASVMPGSCSVPTRPTKTAGFNLTAGSSVTLTLDKHARWVNAFIQVDNPIGTATNPILDVNTGTMALQRNYQTGTWFPDGGPCEVIRLGSQAETVLMSNNGTTTERCFFVQYLDW